MPANFKKPARMGGVLVLLAVACFALASAWWGQHPHQQNLLNILQPPGVAHWLGTDHLGRDTLARLGEACRTSLLMAAGTSLVAVLVGSLLGFAAAWQRAWLDRGLRMLADGVTAIPAFLWVVLVAAIVPGSKWGLYCGLTLTAWVEFFRYTRSQVRLTLAGQPVQACHMLGFDWAYVLRWHVWPEVGPSLARLFCYAFASAVLMLATLGFAGIGLLPPYAELGLLMTEALPYWQEAPWLMAAPAGLLLLIVAALQLLVGTPAAQETT
ncbi:ABC transporter permease [Curvibacter sp. CHRR-16]|uniref:ABC transporter permease n=1 Tax=Curvibacter sp. CHRR-16 TaxID=2835872 RepID=UPI001BDB6162|nr:ABC transporter permease [Curvibacter sp. CHRR-16]MBT0568951.1 ABC transporter permease [Curvibacter sp. CHRR-16]